MLAMGPTPLYFQQTNIIKAQIDSQDLKSQESLPIYPSGPACDSRLFYGIGFPEGPHRARFLPGLFGARSESAVSKRFLYDSG